MFCKYPQFVDRKKSDALRRCGWCMPCRIRDAKNWKHRLVLESKSHVSNAFLTLTYADEHLPSSNYIHVFKKRDPVYNVETQYCRKFAPFSVRPDHHRKFLNKLRYHYNAQYGQTLRFFGVGEYGDESGRPHYHYALFNFPVCLGPGARYIGRRFHPCRCRVCSFLTDIWGKGNIFMGDLSNDSASYISGYVTKKLTSDKSEYSQGILKGRYPEFSRMSNKPGIASFIADRIAYEVNFHELYYNQACPVPNFLVHNGKPFPLGRYLLGKVNEKLAIQKETSEKLSEMEFEMRSLLLDDEDIPLDTKKIASSNLAIALQMVNEGRVTNLETKHRMFSKGKTL